MEINTDPQIIEEILTRGVENIYPTKDEFFKLLTSGKRIKIYQGFDPTGKDLHIGHGVGLRKLAKFQQLGHEVIFLIGDFTAMIGDPTGKLETRKQLTKQEVEANFASYKDQIKQIIDIEDSKNPVRVLYNSTWLSKLTFEDVVELASKITLQQMIERDMFQERIKASMPIGLHEFLYPLMQGYDSVAMDVDLEIGGSDQIFNMLMGRTLMKSIKNKEKFVLANKLLTDNAGKKMGKTEGNMIVLTDEPKNIYGKIMAFTDDIIARGFEILTDIPLTTIESMKQEMSQGENPMKFKKQLAFEVVKWMKGEEEAVSSQKYFEEAFQRHETPEEIDDRTVEEGHWRIAELICDELGLVASRGEAKRIAMQGGFHVNEVKHTDPNVKVEIKRGDIIKVGKSKLIKIK